MPYVLGHMSKSMPQSSRVRALVLLKSKGIKHVFKVQCALLCHSAVLLQGGAFLSLNSSETAAIKSKAHSTCCCILAVFRREHIPAECVLHL